MSEDAPKVERGEHTLKLEGRATVERVLAPMGSVEPKKARTLADRIMNPTNLHFHDEEDEEEPEKKTENFTWRVVAKSLLLMVSILFVAPNAAALKIALEVAGVAGIFSPAGITMLITLGVGYLLWQAINLSLADPKPKRRKK